MGATERNDVVTDYSNGGPLLDVVAPGGTDLDEVISTRASGGFIGKSGTSMATPHVSAVAALLISQGALSPDEVEEALYTTVTDMGAPGWDPEYGWGVMDAFAALMYQRRNGDFNDSGSVDFSDLSILISYWLQNAPTVDIAPSGGDGIINLRDFAALAENWMK